MAETGWSKEFAALGDGWYWSKKTSLPRPRRDVLHVVNSQVAFGSMWLRPDKDPMFFENREWLGPLSPSDFEELIRLRKSASNARGFIQYVSRDIDISATGNARRVYERRLASILTELSEALAHTGEQS